jgi:hypothetical protein
MVRRKPVTSKENIELVREWYRAFHGFGQIKDVYGCLVLGIDNKMVLGLSQFPPLAQLTKKHARFTNGQKWL